MIQFLALDDHFVISRVERLQHNRVAALDILFQRSLAVCAIDQHAQVAVVQRVLTVNEGQVAVGNARLHAVALDYEEKVTFRILDAGILLAVVLLKGEGPIPGADGAHHRDLGFGIATEGVAAHGGGNARLLAQAQQHIGGGIQNFCQTRDGLRIRGGTPGLPLADSLLRHTQHFGNLGLAVPFGLAGLFQALCKHRKSPFYSRVNHILYAALIL